MSTTHTRPDLATHRPVHNTVAIALVQEGKVLLLRHPKDAEAYASMWDLPQAKIADGTAPEDAFAEAAKAELGIDVKSFFLATVVDDLVGDECWRRFVYRVDAFDGKVTGSGMERWYSEAEFADVFQLNPLIADLAIF